MRMSKYFEALKHSLESRAEETSPVEELPTVTDPVVEPQPDAAPAAETPAAPAAPEAAAEPVEPTPVEAAPEVPVLDETVLTDTAAVTEPAAEPVAVETPVAAEPVVDVPAAVVEEVPAAEPVVEVPVEAEAPVAEPVVDTAPAEPAAAPAAEEPVAPAAEPVVTDAPTTDAPSVPEAVVEPADAEGSAEVLEMNKAIESLGKIQQALEAFPPTTLNELAYASLAVESASANMGDLAEMILPAVESHRDLDIATVAGTLSKNLGTAVALLKEHVAIGYAG